MDLTTQDSAPDQGDLEEQQGEMGVPPPWQSGLGGPEAIRRVQTGPPTAADTISENLAARAAPPPFSWDDVRRSPSMQGVSPEEFYKVKSDYWQQYLAPQGVDFDQFDSDTSPGFFEQVKGGLQGVLGQFEQTGGFLAKKLPKDAIATGLATGVPVLGPLGGAAFTAGVDKEDLSRLLTEAGAKNLSEAALHRYIPKYGTTGVRQLLNLTDPGFLKQTAADAVAGLASFGGGMVAGGAAGGATGGPAGAFVGAILGAGGTTALQELGSAYQEYLQKYPGDEQGATNYAFVSAGLTGLLSGMFVAMGPLGASRGPAGELLNPVKHAILQFVLQSGLAGVGHVAGQELKREGLGEDVGLTDGMVSTMATQGLLGTVGAVSAVRAFRNARAKPPQPDVGGFHDTPNPDLPVRGERPEPPPPPPGGSTGTPEDTTGLFQQPRPHPGDVPIEGAPMAAPEEPAGSAPEGTGPGGGLGDQFDAEGQKLADLQDRVNRMRTPGPPAPEPLAAQEPPPPVEAAPAPMAAPEPPRPMAPPEALPPIEARAVPPPEALPAAARPPTREEKQAANREALKRQVEEFKAKKPGAVERQPPQEPVARVAAAPRQPARAPEEPPAKAVRAAERAAKVESPDTTGPGPVSTKPEKSGIFLKGGTGPHSDTIMAMEGKWDAARKGWVVPESYSNIVKELTKAWNNPANKVAAETAKTAQARTPEAEFARAVKSQAPAEEVRAAPGTPVEVIEGAPGTSTFQVKYAPKKSFPTLRSMGGIWNDAEKTWVFQKAGKAPGTKTPIRGAVERLVTSWNSPSIEAAKQEAAPVSRETLVIKATGKTAEISTEAGRKIKTRYHLLDADQLVTSHDLEGKPNPAYPPDLQPRERNRVASKQQIQEMATRINPERLRESPMASEGAPIVGPDAAVESGNGRVLALRQAYENGQAGPYRDSLIQNAEGLGLKREQVEAVKHPVLVRVRQGEMAPEERVAFTREANVAGTAVMSPVEMAKADAERMSYLDRLHVGDNGELDSPSNREFIKHFAESIPAVERGGFIDAAGNLSQAGIARVRNAIFARAYGNVDTLGRMMESTDNNVRNVTTGMLVAAPRLAKLREQIARGERYPIDPTRPMVQAIEELSALKREGRDLKEYLGNQDLFGSRWDPETLAFMNAFYEDARSAKRIGEYLNRVAETIDNLGSPKQEGLFDEGTAETPNLAEIAKSARGTGQGGLFDQPGRDASEGAPPGAEPQSSFGPTGAERQITAAELRESGERIFGPKGPEIRLVDDLRSGAVGEYDPASRTIRVAMDAANPQAVLAHEAIHDARAYLLTKPENAMLDRTFRKGSRAGEQLRAAVERQGYEPQIAQLGHLEERIAHAGQLISAGKLHLDPTTNGILNRLWRAFDRIRNWVNGAGFNTAEEFLRGIQQGKLAGREPGPLRAGEAQQARMPRAADVLSEARRTAMDRPPESILDKILSTPFRLLPVHRLYAQAMSELGKWVPERIKAGIMDRYGETNEMRAARLRFYGEKRHAMREVQGYVERMMNGLEDRNASRIAYQWLTTNDPKVQSDLMAKLPPESHQVLRELKSYISELGKEAVSLGQLSPATQARNDMAYLHRTYAKYELDPEGNPVTRRLIATRILGDQYKRRGLVEKASVERLAQDSPNFDPGTAKGKIFQRLIRTNQDGRVGRYAWVEDHGIVPERFTGPGWSIEKDSAGTPLKWEARWDEGPSGKPRGFQMWRDYTPAEQKEMGVNDEAKYAVARTLFSMHHDIETGHYFRWIAGNPEWTAARSEDIPAGGIPVQGQAGRHKAYLPNEWVQVPGSEVPKSGGVKVYGDLAGKWVKGPLWNEIRQVSDWSPNSRWEWYDKLMGMFKVSKTALSPTTHVNNVAANFVMADWADLKARHLLGSLQDHMAAWRGDEAAKKALQEFEDSGASQGSYAAQELKQEILAPLEEELRKQMMETPPGEAGDHPLHLTRALHMLSTAITGLKAVKDKAVDVYQLEDNLFRYATYKKAIEDGHDSIHAASIATDAFLDYDINAPWVNVARRTGLPFLAFTYRAIPKLNEVVQTKPWKIMKLAMVMGALNGVGYALSGGNEEAERAMLPPERTGSIWGIMPRAIRMPWNAGPQKSPVFWDITRKVPMGDLFSYEQSNSAIPILPMMVPGGPLELLAEFLSNKDSFTGAPITLESDTGLEKAQKTVGHLWKGLTPNFVGWPGSYAYDKVFPTLPAPVQKGLRAVGLGGEGPAMDPFGREYPALEAWASAMGMSIATYPKDMLELRMMQNANYQISELQKQIQQLGKKMGRGAIDQKQFDSKVDNITGKMRKIMDDVNGRLEKGQGMR